jgi:hypothetical protein
VGTGPSDIVFVRGFAGDILSVWEQPLLVRFVEALADFARVILIDKRGTGLSDRVREVPTLETRMVDLRAVMDDLGSESAVFMCARAIADSIRELGIHVRSGCTRASASSSARSSAASPFTSVRASRRPRPRARFSSPGR